MTRCLPSFLGWCVCGVAVVLGAQQASSPRQSPPFSAVTTAITVDVVVRDKRGKPVTDLKRENFALFEDDVRQDVADMTLVAPSPDRLPASPGNAQSGFGKSGGPTADSSRTTIAAPTFVAIVFDRLTPEARALAYRGAQEYLASETGSDFAGVFVSDMSLLTLQAYTNDRAQVARALRAAATRATSVFDPEAIRNLAVPASGSRAVTGDMAPDTPFVASAESAGRSEQVDENGHATGSSSAPYNAHVVEKATTDMWERMARDQQGFATTNALLAVVSGLSKLPGRKTIVFFAEALALPDAVMPHFNAVVAAANRANVSVYTVDAQGLRVHSEEQTTGSELNAIGTQSLEISSDGTPGGSLRNMERVEDVLRKDPRTSLSLLSDQTGGFLIENTNDLASGFRKIDLDRRFHYLLTYTPKNGDFNGEWRAITVKVPSREVQIRARSGYMAVRTPGAIPLLAYEGRAVADLERTPQPAQIPVRAGAFVFPQATGDARVAVLLSTTGRALTFQPTASGYKTDFTLLARLRDATGEVVRKASQPYRLTGPASERDRAQAGAILLYRQPTLPHGQYTLDVVADDALARRGGVMHLPVTVPDEKTGPRVSSLVIIARTEPIATREPADDNVLAVSGVQLYPNLGEPLRKSPDAALSFYAVVLPGSAAVTATLTLQQNSTTLATLPLTLAAPDASGRIQQLGQIPLASIPPGSYDLTLTVSGGPAPVIRSTTFTIAAE